MSSGGAALESRRSDPALDASSMPAQTETAGAIGCGETVTDEVTPDDEDEFLGEGYYADFYGFEGADAFVTASLRAECDRDAGYGPWPLLYLLGPDGAVVAQDQYGGDYGNAVIQSYEVRETGEYRPVASSAYDSSLFEYTLALRCG